MICPLRKRVFHFKEFRSSLNFLPDFRDMVCDLVKLVLPVLIHEQALKSTK